MPVVEFFPQSDKPYWNRLGCRYKILHNPNEHDEHYSPCKHKARYIVDGKEYCKLHAGYVCLEACRKASKEGKA